MSRIALTSHDMRMKRVRRFYVPLATVVAAIFLSLLPMVASAPLIPDFAFLVLIAWRLLRPEMWSARTALPLGLLNDLVAGHPIGQSMALWTTAFLLLDLVDSRAIYRDWWMDWLLAAVLVMFHTFGGWYVGALMGNRAEFAVMLPQAALSMIAYPIVARMIVGLDRWRLTR